MWPIVAVEVLHADVSDVPMEQHLDLVTAIGSDCADPEGELPHEAVDEVDGVGRRLAWIDLQCPYSRGVVDRRVLVTAYRRPLLSL